MAEWFTRDSDGLIRGFVIRGDSPSPTEMERIQNILAGKKPSPVQSENSDPGLLSRVGTGALRSVDTAQASAFRMGELAGHALDIPGLEDWGRRNADEQIRQRETIKMPEDKSIAQATASALGESSSQMGAGIGAALAGAGVGGLAAGPLGAGVGAFIGATGATFPFSLEGDIERQKKEKPGQPIDYGKAAKAASLQSIIEGVTDTATLKVAGVLKKPAELVLESAIKRGVKRGVVQLAKRVGEPMVVGGAAGAIEEGLQQGLERWQADLPLMDDKAKAEYLESAIVGGILQAGIGGTVGAVGGVKDYRTLKQLEQADADAKKERESLDVSGKYADQYEARRTQEDKVNPAGLIEDQRALPDISRGIQVAPSFTEEEYKTARDSLTDAKKVSPDLIKNKLSVGREKANAIFNALVDRGDASRTGSKDQYLKIRPPRQLFVQPVDARDAKPFTVTLKGRLLKERFATQEEANAFAERIRKGQKAGPGRRPDLPIEISQTKPNRWGLYERQIDENGNPITQRLVKAYSSVDEANEAAKGIDLNFGIQESQRIRGEMEAEKTRKLVEAINRDVEPLAKFFRQKSTKLLGKEPGELGFKPRMNVAVLPVIPNPQGHIAEGVTFKKVIALAHDIYDPRLTQEQKQKKMDEVFNHELVHSLRNLDLLKKSEWDALSKAAQTIKMAGKNYTPLQWAVMRNADPATGKLIIPAEWINEEAIAEMVRDYSRDPTRLENPHRTIVGKIVDFLRKLIGLGKRFGPEDVIKSIFSGEVGARPTETRLGPRPYPGNAKFSSVVSPGWYTKTDRFFNELDKQEGTAHEWLALYNRNKSIPKEEKQWIGLEKYLRSVEAERKAVGDDPSISRGDIMDFIRANALDLREEAATDEYYRIQKELRNSSRDDLREDYELTRRLDEIHNAMDDGHFPYEPAANTIYHQDMTQPGGEGYHELKLFLPGLEPTFSHPSHYNGMENIIVAMRATERDFGDGKKTLFLEEMQSDLHQQGKDFGYGNTHGDHKIPDAPFKTTWHELGFKRFVRYAIENGFDQIAWHGEPQSVAATEKFGKLNVAVQSDGKMRHLTRHNIDVTGIVNFYTNRLTNYARQQFETFGVAPELMDRKESVSPTRDEDFSSDEVRNKFNKIFRELFPEKDEFDLYVGIMEEAHQDVPALVRRLRKARQIISSTRDYDYDADVARKAFVAAGIHAADFFDAFSHTFPAQDIVAPVSDKAGNPNFKRWVMPFNAEIIESVMGEGQPMWSVIPRSIQVAVKNPNFKKWFDQSKVRDRDGFPMVLFHHGTFDRDTDIPREGMHFGTRNAALARAYTKAEERAIEEADVKVVLKDDGYYWSDKYGSEGGPFDKNSDAYWAGVGANSLTDNEFYPEDLGNMTAVFLSIKNPLEMADQGTSDQWDIAIERAKTKGYDGIRYRNAFEDKGTTSWIAFKPEQIKSIRSFLYDEKNPYINYSSVPAYSMSAPMGARVPQTPPQDRLQEIEQSITYNNLEPYVAKFFGAPFGGTLKPKVKKVVEATFINVQDRMLPVAKIIDQIKANGGFVTNETDPYLRETLFSGQTDAQLEEADRNFYQPLMEAIKSLNVTEQDRNDLSRLTPVAQSILRNYSNHKQAMTELWLYALHAKERNAKMRHRNERLNRPEQYEAGSGIHDDEADAILDWFRSKPFISQFENVRKLFRALISHTNDIRVAGQLNPDFRTMVNKDGSPVDDYTDYAPLRSWIEEHLDQDEDVVQFAKAGRGFNIQGKEDFSATGRSTLGANIVAHAVLQNEEAIVRANKNKVARSVLNLIREHPEAFNGVAEIVEQLPQKVVYDSKSGRAKMSRDTRFPSDPSVLNIKEGGKSIWVKFNDPRLAKALGSRSNLGNIGIGSLMKMLLGINRFLAATRTSWNPEFLISNMLRDLGAALGNLTEINLPGLKTEVVGSVFPALRGVHRALRDPNTNDEWTTAYREFKRAGGHTAFYGIKQLSDTLDRINKSLSEDPGGSLQKITNIKDSLLKYIEDWNLAIENGTRLATYKALRDRFLQMSGDPQNPANMRRAQERAAFISKNLTVNFNAGGELKPLLNAWWMFFNAGLQGSMALINPMIRSRKVKALWASVVVAGAVQDMLMSMLSPEDKDGQKVYDKITPWVLEHNIVILNPFMERGIIKIPLPYLMNGLYNFGRVMGRGMRGKYTAGEATSSAVGTLAESLNPWGGANSLLNFLAPTVLDPVVELSQNENFMNQPIMPPQDPRDNVSERLSQSYWQNTTPAAVSVADWISRLTGGYGDYQPGLIEVSPNQVEYVYDWLTGGTGTFISRAVNLAFGKNVIGEALSGGEVDVNDIPFARRVFGNVTSKNDVQSYIANRDRVLRIRAELKSAKDDGDGERYRYIIEKYPFEYRVANAINKIENARKKLSKQIKKIRETEKLTDAQKSALVDKIKKKQDELVGRANAYFN